MDRKDFTYTIEKGKRGNDKYETPLFLTQNAQKIKI